MPPTRCSAACACWGGPVGPDPVGGGEPQLYLLLGAGAGMLLYLLAAARCCGPLWEFWADVAGELARLLRLPWIFAAIRQKIAAGSKKGLPFCGKVRYTKHI